VGVALPPGGGRALPSPLEATAPRL